MTIKLLSPDEVASIIGITRKTLRKHVASGAISYVNVGTGPVRPHVAFTQEDVDRFIRDRRVTQHPVARQINFTLKSTGFTALRAEKEKAEAAVRKAKR